MSSEKLLPGSISLDEEPKNKIISLDEDEGPKTIDLGEQTEGISLDEPLKPEAENDQGVSLLTATTAGILSGAIKIPEGVVSLTA
jgi:hypothetical protein